MRKIQFRVWDKQTKLLYKKIDPNGLAGKLLSSVAFVRAHSEQLVNEARHRFVFLQYTGLKDLHGKKIYEGDIVQQYSGGQLRKYLTRVVTYQSNSMYTGFNIGNKSKYEILGNKYENPELVP